MVLYLSVFDGVCVCCPCLMLRSPGGKLIMVSSIDGYCSVVAFDEGALGETTPIPKPLAAITQAPDAAAEASPAPLPIPTPEPAPVPVPAATEGVVA